MNIIIMHDFADAEMALIRHAAPAATVRQYMTEGWDDIAPEELAAAEVLYTLRPLPPPEAAPNLKWVQAHSAGVDGMLNHALFRSGQVRLTTASGVHGINISEFILMMMLALAHKLPLAFEMKQAGKWNGQRDLFVPQELHGATLGLIGYGAIGRRTAQVCRALGMRVFAMRYAPRGDEDGVRMVPREQLHDMLAECDFVAVTAPLTPDTHHIINTAALNAMKRSAFLINISRGDLVDETALVVALRDGRIAGSGLDVFATEPLPDDSPLWRLPNVIMMPHIAGITPHYNRRAAELFAYNLQQFTAGHPLKNMVDFARGY